MNKILIENNKIVSNDSVIIEDDKVIFRSSGEYLIEYYNCTNVMIVFIVKNVDVKILEYSFSNDINVNNRYLIDNGKLRVEGSIILNL